MTGFDPKWADVAIVTRFSGDVGQTITCNDKTNERFTAYNCAIAEHPAFVGGALRFIASAVGRYVYSTASAIYLSDNLFEVDFVLESLGGSGLRGLFRDGLGCMTCRIDAVTKSIEFGIRSASSNPWSMLSHPIDDVDAFVGVRHTLRCSMTAILLSMELDGVTVGTVAHGVSSMATGSNNFAIGNASTSEGDSWIGWIGQFRWTRALRPTEMGLAMPHRFAILGALDPHREKVVAHSHFDGRNDSNEVSDTRGGLIVFSGGAALKTSDFRFGISSASLGGGTIYRDDHDFAPLKFTIEWWLKRPANTGLSYQLAAIMNLGNTAPALSLASVYAGPVSLLENGVSVASGLSGNGPNITWRHFAIVRDGDWLAVFVSGTRALLYNIGTDAIQSSGRLMFGPSYDWIDEHRVTIGEARYNVQSSVVSAPTERFNEYGPRSMSGEVVGDPDGLPLPNILVRAYHSASGRLVSEAYTDADGKFSLPVADTSEHFWVAHHPTENALINDHIVPVLA